MTRISRLDVYRVSSLDVGYLRDDQSSEFVACALGYNEEAARLEWVAFLSGRLCATWNQDLLLCVKESVDVKSWLLWVKSTRCPKPPAPATMQAPSTSALRGRLKAWQRMGNAVTSGEHEHANLPILHAIA
jgi:hypothetical protein